MSLFIQETFTNIYNLGEKDENRVMCSSTLVYKTMFSSFKDVFNASLKRFGRCVSKMYSDTENGDAQQIGWVFQRRSKTIPNLTYETCVSVHTKKPEEVIHYFYATFPGDREKEIQKYGRMRDPAFC